MNPNNLIGKTKLQQKNMYEVDLIADYEMEYGDPTNWSEEVASEFDKKWDNIQIRFSGSD